MAVLHEHGANACVARVRFDDELTREIREREDWGCRHGQFELRERRLCLRRPRELLLLE
jgi:hypothetical protein